MLFKKPKHTQQFAEYMNKQHSNIRFSVEAEKNGALPFLDINIQRENGKFVSSVYRKETFSGVYTSFTSFIPLDFKFSFGFCQSFTWNSKNLRKCF